MSTANSWADSLVDQIAERVYQRIACHIASESKLGDKLTYGEAEAAELIGIPKHVLKGARERGEIQPVKIGKGFRYSRDIIVGFVNGKN